MPERSSLGRNHDAQTGMVLGSGLMRGGFFARASESSLGVTIKEEKKRLVGEVADRATCAPSCWSPTRGDERKMADIM